jgi:EAL domain-containing protein (putative c-di-GMP-specific phosphodiesterase class I)
MIPTGSEIEITLENKVFLEALITKARRIKVPVIVGQIETQQVWESLNEIGIDAGQGVLFGPPVVLSS